MCSNFSELKKRAFNELQAQLDTLSKNGIHIFAEAVKNTKSEVDIIDLYVQKVNVNLKKQSEEIASLKKTPCKDVFNSLNKDFE